MKYLRRFRVFEGVSDDRQKNIDMILSYIEGNTKHELYEYAELFHIQKGNQFLNGRLYLSLLSNKALRFNWVDNDIINSIKSIDIWLNFTFDSKPSYTMEFNDIKISDYLSEILQFYNNPSNLVDVKSAQLTEEIDLDDLENEEDLEGQLKDFEDKYKRARKPEKKEEYKEAIDRIKVYLAGDEVASTDSLKVNMLDDELKIDVFRSIELYTIQVARGRSNSLIITGQAGVGKTSVVTDTLSSIGYVKDVDYYKATGTVTTAGLYEVLFKNRNNLVVFDDCDAVFKEPDSVNLLKGALDTYETRELSKLTKSNTFDSTGMSDEEIQAEYDASDGKKMPNRFEFNGKIIFISNLASDKFDEALISRSLHVDVHLNRQEILDRMAELMKKIAPDVSEENKKEALDYLNYITEHYPVKFDLNIRTLIHAINLRANNDTITKIGDREEATWKLLLKKYLIKTK